MIESASFLTVGSVRHDHPERTDMYLDSTTRFQLADAQHRARVRAATLRHASVETKADRDFLRRSMRLTTWRSRP
jgi:hypothetical protein